MLRIARTQGLLGGGRDSSPVATMAVAILENHETYEQMRRQVEVEIHTIKAALLGTNPSAATTLFPDYFIPTADEAARTIEDRIEQDEISADVSSDIERWIAEQGGVMTGADLDDEGEWS